MPARSGSGPAGGRSGGGRSGGAHGHGQGHAQQDQSSVPMPDAQTFRDLLIFEERLKQSATRLQRRKKKYETLLALSCGGIALLSYHVFIDKPDLLILHRLNLALLLFLCTSVFLFFASGMYADRIVAANKFVPQANRSLRNFNMYLNTRTAPRRGILARVFLPFLKPSRPGSARRSNPPSRSSSLSASPTKDAFATGPEAGRSSSPQSLMPPPASAHGSDPLVARAPDAGATSMSRTSSGARRSGLALPIAPSANPRGELIFNSKVSPAFRDGYERYRAAFERRRSEKLEAKRRSGWRWWLYTGAGWGWWVKEIWKPPEPEPLPHAPHHAHAHAHAHHARGGAHAGGEEPAPQRRARVTSGGHAPSGRTRSGTAGSIGSVASSGSESVLSGDGDSLSGHGGSRRSSVTGSPSKRSGKAPGSAGSSGSSSARHSRRLASISASSDEGTSAALQRTTRHNALSDITTTLPIGTRSRRSKDYAGGSMGGVGGGASGAASSYGSDAGGASSGSEAGERGRGRDATPSPVASSSTSMISLSPSPSIFERSSSRGLGADDAAADEDAPLGADAQPLPAAVAATADDRSDPLSTLREPDTAPPASAPGASARSRGGRGDSSLERSWVDVEPA